MHQSTHQSTHSSNTCTHPHTPHTPPHTNQPARQPQLRNLLGARLEDMTPAGPDSPRPTHSFLPTHAERLRRRVKQQHSNKGCIAATTQSQQGNKPAPAQWKKSKHPPVPHTNGPPPAAAFNRMEPRPPPVPEARSRGSRTPTPGSRCAPPASSTWQPGSPAEARTGPTDCWMEE